MLHMQRQQGNAFVQRLLASAPALDLPVRRQEENGEESEPVEPVPDVEGEGEVHEEVAYSGEEIRLHGSVAAEYNGGSFRTEGVTTERGEGCTSCGRGNPCVHVTGTLLTDYDVGTTISLPDVPSGLTPCQTMRAQEFIDGVLAEHEQAHVDAMEGYNGSTSRPFDLMLCRSRFPASIRAMVAAEEVPRREAAQGASDLLDPFERVVDLDCEEEEEAED
jgi:hypothetical protein